MIHRKFIAAVVAASMALTAVGAAPAAAQNYNAERALAAILGLAVVGAIVHENRKDKKRNDRAPVYQPEPRPLPDRVNRKLLPQRCLRSQRTYDGRVRYFGKRCLNRHYSFADRLPRRCVRVFDTDRGERRGYLARCLRDRGYRLARG